MTFSMKTTTRRKVGIMKTAMKFSAIALLALGACAVEEDPRTITSTGSDGSSADPATPYVAEGIDLNFVSPNTCPYSARLRKDRDPAYGYVSLTADPGGTAVITVSTSDPTDLQVTPSTTYTFNSSDWSTPQEFFVSTLDTVGGVQGNFKATLTASSPGLTSANGTVNVWPMYLQCR